MLGKVYTLITILILIKSSSTKNISFDIEEGEYARIVDFPHSAYIRNTWEQMWTECGASILNQRILLTAAHCVISETYVKYSIVAYTGHANRLKAKPSKVSDLKIHENYNPTGNINNDVALLILEKEIEFGRRVRRVALMLRPPFEEGAEIAGWGLTMEQAAVSSDLLKYTKQRVLLREICEAQICEIPPGSFCAKHPMGIIQSGDSGSALVVRRYIQIGLVSFCRPSLSHRIEIYTNVSYHLPWIRKAARKLYCARNG